MAAPKNNTFSRKKVLYRMNKSVLIKKCKQYNLPTYGTKNDMIDRIILAENRPQRAIKTQKKTNIKNRSSSKHKNKNNQLLQSKTSIVIQPNNVSNNGYIQPQTKNPSKKKKKKKHKKHASKPPKQRKQQNNKINIAQSMTNTLIVAQSQNNKPLIMNNNQNINQYQNNNKKKKKKHKRKSKAKNRNNNDLQSITMKKQNINNINNKQRVKNKNKSKYKSVPIKTQNININNKQNTNITTIYSNNSNNINKSVPTLQRWYNPPNTTNNTNKVHSNKQQSDDQKHQQRTSYIKQKNLPLPLFIVRDHCGPTQIFTDWNYTIKQLKQQISDEMLGLDINAFSLSIQNLKPLHKEDLSLSDYNIQRGTKIHIHLYTHLQIQQQENPFYFIVKLKNNATVNGKENSFKITSVQPSDSVFILKTFIQQNYNIPIKYQKLCVGVFFERNLENNRILSEYNINNGDIIHLEVMKIENDYFDELIKDDVVSIIDIHSISSLCSDLQRIYYIFLKAMVAMNGELIGLLQIDKNKKQNMLIYESLLSTMDDKTEDMLFHGTTFDNVDKIILNGFNRDYNINAKYGKGTYFAKSARYAALYSKQDIKTGHLAILVCRCIIGRYGLGKQYMNETELYHKDNPGQQYDSLVNDLNDPQIYVINRDYHAIPIYVILFKYKTNNNT